MVIEDVSHINNPLVSVLIITYNQENTIVQTIESILVQEGNFTLELVIGEDCSADRTAEICKEYQKKYPEKIKLLLQEENQGILKNFIDTIRLCRGKYIGMCAGDDYCVINIKFKSNLIFRENPDFGVVGTGGYRLLVKKNKLVEGIAPHPVADGMCLINLAWRFV